MTDRVRSGPTLAHPRRLLLGVSMAAMASGLALPAHAQLARLRAAAGTSPVPTAVAAPVPLRPVNMREALARTQALQTRADQIRGYVTAARDAALAATRGTRADGTPITDGLDKNGLDPIDAVKQATQLLVAGGEVNIAKANALMATVTAANDGAGVATWEGASAPVQTSGNGKTQVTITQNQERALLSWNRFDVGANTELTFVQKQNGVAQAGWTVVNRVVSTTAPSSILGSVKADGTVLVLNRNGVIFGPNSQVKLGSLLASTLEIGNFGRNFREIQVNNRRVDVFDAITLKERNTDYLQNGLFAGTPQGILPALLLSPLYSAGTFRTDETPPLEGAITVDAGASISAANGGFLILAGPTVTNGGTLSAAEGQVSLQGGRLIAATRSTGAVTSIDQNVRGLILRTIGTVTNGVRRSSAATPLTGIADDGTVINTGLIEANRGYLSLGAGLFGTVTNAGLLASTTSVSRNGKISLTAGTVNLGGSSDASKASGIVILPEDSNDTIPQGTADNPAAFKTSQIEIGARADDPNVSGGSFGEFIPNIFAMGQNALILAPSANVIIGRDSTTAFNPGAPINTLSSITIANGAAIDVSGVKDVQLAASRNSIEITPVKRNELRDTPNYREVSLTGDFTLNGKTLFVDPRLSGVRADGVAWVGSPLIEAGSIASQIGVTAAELMTKGGNVAMGVNLLNGESTAAKSPRITIASGATIDVSGGWVHYNEGVVRTSNLLTTDGRIVNIGEADPNDFFAAVAEGFTEYQPRFGEADTYKDPLLQGTRFEAAYDEGRDAGSLVIGGSALTINGSLYGEAYAGARQLAGAVRGTIASTIVQDGRLLQRTAQDLPTAGFLRIGSLTGTSGVAAGGNIAVYAGASTSAAQDGSTLMLSDQMLSRSGMAAVSLQTTGGVSFAKGSSVTLADGGALRIDAGRSIVLGGDIKVASGTIAARTYEFATAPIVDGSLSAIGSAFTTKDNITNLYAVGEAPDASAAFDITVTGRLSTAGRFVNDYATTGLAQGSAFLNGGSISLTVAPKVFVALGDSVATAQDALDLSGRITIASGARLDVSAGAYVAPDRTFNLTARGGNISLINETTYASTVLTIPPANETSGRSDAPIAGSNQSVDFTRTDNIVPALVPSVQRASVSFDESAFAGFGFTGGGTFALVAPEVSFGSQQGGAHVSLDFFRKTGFGTLDVTAFHSRIVPDIFTNDRQGNSAFFETTTFKVGAGETLDLTQSLLPAFLDRFQSGALLSLRTGSEVSAVLTPGVPLAPFDRVAANLTLRGLTEFDVAKGGKVVGAAGATITTPKLYNAGSIVLPGGSIVQREFLPVNLAINGLGVTSLSDVFGEADANGQYDENAENTAGVTDALGRTLTVRELFTLPASERFVYLTGTLGADEGIRLAGGSVTDLSGVALVNTRAPYLPSGEKLLTGRIVAGGSISTATPFNPPAGTRTFSLFTAPVYGSPRYGDASLQALPPIVGVTGARTFNALAGAQIDLTGANALFDQQISPTAVMRTLQWSNGGTLTVGGGGSLAGALIDARGGAAPALGGTLNWLRPTIIQSYGRNRSDNVVAADQIEDAGFSTMNALGGVTFSGKLSLTLGKAFTVQSAPTTTGVTIAPEAAITVSATRNTDATINAPFIRFASRLGSVDNAGDQLGRATGEILFRAGAGIDFFGATLFDSTISSVGFVTPGDVRFIGVDDRVANSLELPSLNGQVISWGDMNFDAGRVYATTGTGNLQRFVEDQRAGNSTTVSPFLVAAIGQSAITFGGKYMNAVSPLSAGTYLKVQASEIVQGGYLAAPLGLLELGSNEAITIGSGGPTVRATSSLTFTKGSVTTVSGAGLNVPYGTTTDLTEYYFAPSVGLPITAVPTGQLTLSGGDVTIEKGAKMDGRGGGDVFAFEFVSGTGGSRDVLDRFNRDAFSSNGYNAVTGVGYQFADQRQVYAIVPKDQAQAIAAFDPIYSSDYLTAGGGDIYGSNVGMSVTLDGSTGVPAGEYLLMPAHYALLPGAYRLVENVGVAAPAPGASQTLLDGSVIVGGTFSTAGTKFADSTRRSFILQSKDVFSKFSRIETTGGTKTVVDQATTAGKTPPRIPLDAARVVLAPKASLTVAGLFDTTPATGGKGAQFDILATNIQIVTDRARPTRGTLVLTDDTVAALNANSLSFGAERSENEDGTTNLGIVARTITIDRGVSLTAPELIFAVGGNNSALTVGAGAKITATGKLDDTATGDYVVPSIARDQVPATYPYDATGIGAVLRLSSGGERLITRDGDEALRNTEKPAKLQIANAQLTGKSIAIDTSQQLSLSNTTILNASNIALSGDVIRFGDRGISDALLTRLGDADHLTLRSRGILSFSRGTYEFNGLRLDAPAVGLTSGSGGAVTLKAGSLELGNTADDLGACTGNAALACGNARNTLAIVADDVRFLSGTVHTYGFAGGVSVTGTEGMYVEGAGKLDVGKAALTLTTPFIADRAEQADPSKQVVRPDYAFLTTGAVKVAAPAVGKGQTAPTPAGNAAPGTQIAFGSGDAAVASLSIDGTDIRATSGVIDIQSRGNVTLTGGASLATPGYTRTFGDAVDSVTVSSGAGAINLVSLTGNLSIGAGSTLTVDTGVGSAGVLNLIASNGAITFKDFGGALNPTVTGTRDASLSFDSGKSAFDLAGFAKRYGSAFQGDLAIRSSAGGLTLDAGQTLRARSVELVADGGAIAIGGTIDTSGVSIAGLSTTAAQTARVNGGDVTLYGMSGVTLGAGSLIDTHTRGYTDSDTRTASAGDVTIGIGNDDAAITFAQGARIDAGATRTEAALANGQSGNRLIAQTVKDPFTLADTTVYRLALADTGGTVSFRAPVIENGSMVDVRLGGTITGADSIQIEGFQRYDLDAIANSGQYAGVTKTRTGVSLSFLDGAAGGPRNILTQNFVGANGLKSVVNFIQGFDIRAKDGSSFEGIRLRPGIQLDSTGSIALATNWNLGAGTLNESAALAAGLLTVIPQLGTRPDGTPYYAVTPGREAELFQNYVSMLYRVGGKVSGEAGIVTLRARGNLDIAHSISDGFFSFRDRTDPGYMSYQLGGGDRDVAPAAMFGCGTRLSGDCSIVQSFDRLKDRDPSRIDPDTIATISLVSPVAGSDLAPGILAPYSAAANSAAALGSGRNGAGDPLGGSDLFPLLEDGTRAVRSTSLRLVAGADAKSSANPLHVDRATGANVTVSGETKYTIVAREGNGSYSGNLELRLQPVSGSLATTPTSATPGNFIDAVANSDDSQGLDPTDAQNYYTVLNWGGDGAIATTTLARAREYFAANFPDARFQTDRSGNVTGVAAPLSAVIGFLQAYGPEYARKIESGAFPSTAPTLPAPASLGAGDTAYVGTIVRTGDGNIDMAAAHNIDLRRTETVVYRNPLGGEGNPPPSIPVLPTLSQVGGTAVYTAGQLMTRQVVSAATADGMIVNFTMNPTAAKPAFDELAYKPTIQGVFLNTPELLVDGGDMSLTAATGQLIARRDVWAEQNVGTGTNYIFKTISTPRTNIVETIAPPLGFVGASDQRWRVGQVGENTQISVVPQLFTSGVGALGGGDVAIKTKGAITDLTLALDTSVTTTNPLVPAGTAAGNPMIGTLANGASAPPVLLTFGGGNASVSTGGDLIGSQFDFGSGFAKIDVGGNVYSAGGTEKPTRQGEQQGATNELRIRVADAYVAMDVAGTVDLGGLGGLGAVTNTTDPTQRYASLGYFSAGAGVSVTANGTVTLNDTRPELVIQQFSVDLLSSTGFVLPPSLGLTSITNDIVFGGDVPRTLFPSAQGQLSLVAGGEIQSLALAMSDVDPSLLPGAFSVRNAVGGANGGIDFGFNGVFPTTTDAQLRLFHNQRPTHAADDEPVRIYAGGSITNVTLSLAKQARIGAGLDIVDMIFSGQNVRDGDVTRITAGRDIIGTTAFSAQQRLPYIRGNSFTLGGYGTLAIEAGRNLGPFINSATVGTDNGVIDFAGGIRTIGNDQNPWLESRGASIQALFGIAKGADYDALQSVYLDPANAAKLDGDLFVQISDTAGNLRPDRTKPIYAPILAAWMRDNAPEAFTAVFGASAPTGDALTSASYTRFGDLYSAFAGLDNLSRRTFLIDRLYFNELSQTGIPTGPSYQQYIRGYRAQQTLFSPTLGYTDNLATYTTDPSTVSDDHPLGQPTKNVVNGEPAKATRVFTGNVDLRLATIETARGGDITILGPGGDVLAGSVVRTSDQAARRATLFGVPPTAALENGFLSRLNQNPISAIPIGFEGVLTLRGGAIRSSTDGDFRLNQSRLFTLAGGDITMWSSNGDLNAGQGPRSASSVPAITVRFDQNGLAEVDSAGSVAGAGIGAFKADPSNPDASIILVAPVGEVDAGDAGVRASGSIFVAAARVANADNFSAGGSITGVPAGAATASAALPSSAASSIVGALNNLTNAAANNTDRPSLISVDVLGFLGSDPCDDPNSKDCKR